MVKSDGGPVDPKVEKRRQKNKVASAKCRERKLKRAQLLQQEVSTMRNKVDEKRENLHSLKSRIDKYKSFLTRNKGFLTDDEKKRLNNLVHKVLPEPPISPEEQKVEDEELSSSQNTIDVTPDQKNMKIATKEPVNDSGREEESDVTDDGYKAEYEDASSFSSKEGTNDPEIGNKKQLDTSA